MPFQGDELYHDQSQILASFMAAFQARIPDVWLGEDGNLKILIEIEAGQIEGLYLANQLLLEDMFVQSANLIALRRHGAQYGIDQKVGTVSIGILKFTGQGGVYIPIGTEVDYDPGGGQDPLYFITTADGVIPNPGIPSAPTAADAGAGTLAAGTYEYAVTFQTAAGETTPGDPSNAVAIAINHNITLTNIPLGGPGPTIARNLYQQIDGGAWTKVTTPAVVAALNNNTTTTVTVGFGTYGGPPPTIDTATQLSLAAQSESPGLEYNAVAGAIRDLANVPDGITDVTNPAPFSGGTDEEDIDTYRTRIQNVLRSPASGSPTDLKNWAEAIPGVESATVFSNDNLGTPTPGHATVRISGPNGTVPPTPVIDAVAAELVSRDLANITLHVTTFTQSTLAVAVNITSAPNYIEADLYPNVKLAVQQYVASVPVGGTVYISGIIQHVREVVGVADVVVTVPASNQTAAATTKFVTNTTDVTVT